MKKEITIDARMATSSGIGTYIRSIVPKIQEFYHIKLLIHPDTSKRCPELQSCEQIFTFSSIYSIQEQIELPLKIPKCDLFWSPHFNIPLLPIRAKKRLATIHDVLFLAHSSSFLLHKRLYARLFFQKAAKLSDRIITISKFSHFEILKHIGPYEKKIDVISLGVNAPLFSSPQNKAPCPLPSKFLLYVGNLSPHKNIVRLIQALDFLPPETHLVLAGKENTWNAWKKEVAKRRNQITVLGAIDFDALVWLYQNAQMLIHPSLYEGFGLTPLEAMSAGCVVIASDIACLRETCQDAALFVDPFSPQNIGETILLSLENLDLQQALKTRGKERAELFSWSQCALSHMQVFDELMR